MFTIWNKPILDVHKYAASVENDPLCQVFQTKQYIEHDLSCIVHANTVHKLVLEYRVSSIYSHKYICTQVFFIFFQTQENTLLVVVFLLLFYNRLIGLPSRPRFRRVEGRSLHT